jgi:hypothetical protein
MRLRKVLQQRMGIASATDNKGRFIAQQTAPSRLPQQEVEATSKGQPSTSPPPAADP